jgi:hypothetical protein
VDDPALHRVVIVQPPERPSGKTSRGRNEFRAAFTEWPSQWDAFELEQDRFDVFTFRDGKVSVLELFHTREQALAAADTG